MAPSSSSTKKAAKLAKSGQGKKVRFQGGTLFPMVVVLVVALGIGLIAYSRQSRPPADASAPTVSDHWHHAYGFYLCDTWFMFEGALEEQLTAGGFLNQDYQRTGIHSHDDGLMHWHPFTSAAVGQRAKLGLFLENYGVELTNTKLTFPEAQTASPDFPAWNEDGVFEEGETTCSVDDVDEDAELKVVVWNNYTDTDDGTTYIADFENIKLNQDQMVVSIAFVPPGTSVSMPPWASNLPELSLNDMSQLRPEDVAATTGTDVSVPPSSDTVAGVPSSDTVAEVPSSDTVAEVPSSTDG